MGPRIIFHISADSAYLSWEAVYRIQHGDSPDLRTVPSVAGGPGLIIVPPNYGLYMQCSRAIGGILREYSPFVEQYAVDEYFMDMTDMEKIYRDPLDLAYKLEKRVKEELGFAVNIGISSNKVLAKMASELKLDKVQTIFPHEIAAKMWCLPIEELFMVDRAAAKKLRGSGINTIGALAQADLKLVKLLLKSHGVLLWNYANGNDCSPVRENRPAMLKEIGSSRTIPFEVKDRKTARLVLLSLTEAVASRLRQGEYCAGLVSVSLKANEFYSCSRQRKITLATDCTNAIYRIACQLFDELWRGESIRHLGVRVAELSNNDFKQFSLFQNNYEKQRALDRTIDLIRERFGADAVFRSSFLNSGVGFKSGGTIDDEEYFMMSSRL